MFGWLLFACGSLMQLLHVTIHLPVDHFLAGGVQTSKDLPFMDSKYSYDSKAVRLEYKKLNQNKVLQSVGLLVPYCLVEPQ